MSCFGNTIARALALVSIGTAAAFVHWGLYPPTLELAAPKGSTTPGVVETQDEPTTQTPEPETEPQHNIDDPGNEVESTPDEQAVFDPFSLGTEIGTTDTYQLWITGEVIFIDARPAHEYLEGHIPYAYLIPVETIDQGRLGDMMDIGGVDPSQRVVVYCEGGLCDASKLVALTLQDLGFTMIHIDLDGFPAWQAAGYEVETGPDAMLGDVP